MRVDLTGRRFGTWTVTKYFGKASSGKSLWECRCDCGSIKNHISTNVLTSGKSTSCGCFRVKLQRQINTQHGNCKRGANTSEYNTWLGMKARCYNKNNDRYADWGGRGIVICDRWLRSFENFLADMGAKPTPAHSIERNDNDKDYCPENCRWATKKEQNSNTRSNHWLEYDGRRMILQDWCKELQKSRSTITKHLKKKTFNQVIEYYKNKTNDVWKEKRRHSSAAVPVS